MQCSVISLIDVNKTYFGDRMEIITAIIAFLVAIITIGHFLNNRAKLRLDLFDKRFEQFELIAGFLSDIVRSGFVSTEEVKNFLQDTRSAYYVFGCNEEIRTLIEDIYTKAKLYRDHLRTIKTSDEERRLSDEERRLFEWFSDTLNQINEPTSIFTKYLMLDINIRYYVVKLLKKDRHGRGNAKDSNSKQKGRSRQDHDRGQCGCRPGAGRE